MTKALRVILEIGKKRKVVAAAMDWPGLDRWGTSEDNALEKLLSYVPRYADVAERAGMASAFARSRDIDVVERVPGSSSTDFWGIAHVPSQIEAEVLRRPSWSAGSTSWAPAGRTSTTSRPASPPSSFRDPAARGGLVTRSSATCTSTSRTSSRARSRSGRRSTRS